MIEELNFPAGCRLLSAWQAKDKKATKRLKEIFDGTIDGQYDENFRHPEPPNTVHVSSALNLMTLTIMHELYGHDSAEFYKGDPERYVRTTLMSRRLLANEKLYVSWPVYAFSAEALGQTMMYPDKFPPGTDPDKPLVDRHSWPGITTPDLNAGIPKLLNETLACYQRLTGLAPILHLSAPYSLAADVYGQEHLLTLLSSEPDLANRVLDHLVDHVLQPWIADFFKRFPTGWVELSDASGSPFFIGPQNCKNLAIRSIQRLVDENDWHHRVYDANYRGDYVTQVKRSRVVSKRRKASQNAAKEAPPAVSLQELLDLKFSICRDFVIRLDDDRVPISFYQEQAIKNNIPLFLGIGAGQIDRNSIKDMDIAKRDIEALALEYVKTIKDVAKTITANGYNNRKPPWPGGVYFEDISSETSFELVEVITTVVLSEGAMVLET